MLASGYRFEFRAGWTKQITSKESGWPRRARVLNLARRLGSVRGFVLALLWVRFRTPFGRLLILKGLLAGCPVQVWLWLALLLAVFQIVLLILKDLLALLPANK